MSPENREQIVQILSDFKDTDIARVFDKWHFYFNKQAIMLTNVDEKGKSFEGNLPVKTNKSGEEVKASSLKLDPVSITQTTDGVVCKIDEFKVTSVPAYFKSIAKSIPGSELASYYAEVVSPFVSKFDYKESDLVVTTVNGNRYWFDQDKETLIEENNGKLKELGCGKIAIKSAFKKPSKTQPASIEITVELTPDYQKDYEIIPYSPIEEVNQQGIADFMAKYITKPFQYLDNTIGAEINFNKVFYKPEALREVNEIVAGLLSLENDLKTLEQSLNI